MSLPVNSPHRMRPMLAWRGGLSLLRRAWSLLKRLGPEARVRRRLADRHLRGDGIEIGALHNPLHTSARVTYVDRLSRADLRRHYPELAAFPVVDPDIVDDGERLTKVADSSQDFIIANHFIEHCEDPIGTLEVFARKLKPNGIVYLAVPDKRYTFDKHRPSTSFEHLELDRRDGGAASRWAHYLEFARLTFSPAPPSVEAAEASARDMESKRYSIHFHVWDFSEFADFLDRACATAVPALQCVDRLRNGAEGVFILRRIAGPSGP